MTEKTKLKIEAMAKEETSGLAERYDGCYHPKIVGTSWFKEGATPWAEWCERFDNCFDKKTGAINMTELVEVQRKYREWLDQK